VREKNITKLAVLFLIGTFLLTATVTYAQGPPVHPELIYTESNISGVLAWGQDKTHGPYDGVITVSVKITDLWIANPVQEPPQPWVRVRIYKWPSGTTIWTGDLGDGDSSPWVSTNGGLGTTIKVNVDNYFGVYDEDYHYSGKVRMYIN